MNHKLNKIFYQKCFLSITIFFLLCILYPAKSSLAATTKSHKTFSFAKTYSKLNVGKKVHYKVKNLKKGQYALYSVSNRKIASIHKKSGWLSTKKKGKIKVKASIYNKKKVKIKTLTDWVIIRKRNSYLPHVTFKIKEQINPWNFTFTLSSSRILLKKEVAKSTLTLLPKGKKKPKITAAFTKISGNGKDITFTIRPSCQHTLCPGDSSKNGTYTIQSSLFPKKLAILYTERLTKNTLSGFVFQSNGNPIHNAYINLKTSSNSFHCYTDSNGYYQIANITKPVSLTITKAGYQKKTISAPNVSSKGTMCENIILKSAKDTSASLDFLVTDYNNNPIPDAVIEIFSSAKQISKKSMNQSNSSIDTFADSDSLFYGTTNSSGKLSLTNHTNSIKNTPCTNILLNQQMQISYNTSYTPNQSNQKILSSKTFNINDSYIIYISKNLTNNHSVESFYTNKLYFAFTELDTSQALIHVQLEKCPTFHANNLSIKWDSGSDMSLCASLHLSLYHADSHEPLYEATIEKENFKIYQNTIKLQPSSFSFSLPDDIYYIQLCARSKDNKLIGLSSIEPLQIKDKTIFPHEINLQQSYYSRVLAYSQNLSDSLNSSNTEKTSPLTASFHLYQIWDNHYFLIDTVTSTPFIKYSYDLQLSNLIVSSLLKNHNYLLLPSSDSMTANTYTLLKVKEENIYTNENGAIMSLTPFTQISCEPISNFNIKNLIPADFIIKNPSISYLYEHKLTQNLIRSCQTYPNAIIAFYQNDGTLLTTSLTTKAASKMAACAFTLSSKKSSIIDIYINKEILITSQDSYHKN